MTEISCEELGLSVLRQMRAKVSPECFQRWFGDLSVLTTKDGVVRFLTSNTFRRQWLEDHYKNDLLSAVKLVLPEVRDCQFGVFKSAPAERAMPLGKVLSHDLQRTAKTELRGKRGFPDGKDLLNRALCGETLSPDLRLENFIVGVSNRNAFTAAQVVAESPGLNNPVYLHGSHGVGKTHLLQGIAHQLHQGTGGAVACMTGEAFCDTYVRAAKDRSISDLRLRLRSVRALLIDDIQFICNKRGTQEELLHTFDELKQAKKQIVLAGNCNPRELKDIDQRLQTRFCLGLVEVLHDPEFELRVQVLVAKAKAIGLPIPLDAAQILALHVVSTPMLEGAVRKLRALAQAEKRAPDRELAYVALRDLGYLRAGPPSLDDVLNQVAQHYDVSADQVRSGRRQAALVRARHVAMFLGKLLTKQSVADLGRFFGNRDHTTVLHALRKIEETMRSDEHLRQEVRDLKLALGCK